MKKAFALALALVFALTLAIPAFAASTNDATLTETKDYNITLTGTANSGSAEVEDDGVDQTIIRYDVAGNYEITIPALIELKSTTTVGEDDDQTTVHTPEVYATQTATVTAAKVMIPYTKELVVTMKGSTTAELGDAFAIATSGQVIQYTVKKDAGATTIAPATTPDASASSKDVLVIQEGGVRADNDDGGYTGGSVELTFTATSLPKYQARYEGHITFTVSLRTYTAATPQD